MDLEFTPGILDTPSLMTPNISINPLIYKPLHTISTVNDDDSNNNNNNNNPSSNPSSITTTTDESSSAETKLSKIENDLKTSFTQPRKPTESPFQKMAEAGVLTMEKNIPLPPTTDDEIPVDIPSTAEVMNDIESFSKYPTKDISERETTTSDNNRFDTSSSSPPPHTMGVIVSPKKKLIIRSQSHTEPTSPPTNHFSQSQKLHREDESSNDGDNNHFPRVQDLPPLTQTTDSSSQLNNHLNAPYTLQLRTNSNGVHPAIIKQQPVVPNNKRPFPQTVFAASLPKANQILLSQQPAVNEVTSTDQILNIKRQKMTSMPSTAITLRSSVPSSTNDDHRHNNNNDNNNTNDGGSDDQRKRQIRDSNREAARRCRERRRNYIEQLEGNLEQCKTQIKQLTESLARAERENTQLRAIITETKIFHPATRLPSNESLMDFATVITTNGIDLNSESTDGNTIQRSYITRNTH